MLWTTACTDLLEGLDWLCDIHSLSGAERQSALECAEPFFRQALVAVKSLDEPANPQAAAFRETHAVLGQLLAPVFAREVSYATWRPRLVRDIATYHHSERAAFERLHLARTA